MSRGAFPTRQVTSIVMLLAALVAVIVLKSRCGKSVEGLFKALDQQALTDGGAAHD